MKLSTALQPHLKGIHEIISGCFDDYDKFYSPEAKLAHGPSCKAHNLNEHMRERASRYAARTPGVGIFDSQGLRGILINQCIALVFKKLDDERNPRNNITDHMTDYLNQKPIEGLEAQIMLVAGYTENKETGEMAEAYLIRPSGVGHNRWEMLLSAGNTTPVVTELFDQDDEIEEADVTKRREPAKIIPFKEEDGKQS